MKAYDNVVTGHIKTNLPEVCRRARKRYLCFAAFLGHLSVCAPFVDTLACVQRSSFSPLHSWKHHKPKALTRSTHKMRIITSLSFPFWLRHYLASLWSHLMPIVRVDLLGNIYMWCYHVIWSVIEVWDSLNLFFEGDLLCSLWNEKFQSLCHWELLSPTEYIAPQTSHQ